jgi:hypothetical protein
MLGAGLVLAIVLVATASSGAIHGPIAAVIVGATGLLPIAATLIAWRANPARRERAWQLEAVGLGVLAVLWLGIMSR